MEFQNRIDLRGVIGRADVNSINQSKVCNFSVVTEYSSMDREGNPVIETTWFNVSAWEGRSGIPELSSIQRGAWVHVIGRVRMRRYTTQDNEERTTWDVLARKVEILPREEDENAVMAPQRDY